jgi:transcription elongation factor Elf1
MLALLNSIHPGRDWTMTFVCISCSTTNCVQNRAVGTAVTCTNCKASIIVPGLSSRAAPVLKANSAEKENTQPELQKKLDPPPLDIMIGFNCPVCGTSDEVPERVAKQKIQCKQCGVVCMLKVDGISVEVASIPVEPPSTPIRFFCPSCEFTSWGKGNAEVRCNRCRLVITPLDPDKKPSTAKCRECGTLFPIDSEDSTLCSHCRNKVTPLVVPPPTQRNLSVFVFYLLAVVLVGLVVLMFAQLLGYNPVGLLIRAKPKKPVAVSLVRPPDAICLFGPGPDARMRNPRPLR